MLLSGFAVGIYTTNSPEACLHCINTSRANIVVVEDDSQLQKILKIKQQAPSVKAIVQYSGTPTDPSVLNVSIYDTRANVIIRFTIAFCRQWNDFLELGRTETDERLDSIIKDLAPNQCCSILFTVCL